MNADIMSLQAALAKLGFDPGPLDGLWGRKTEAAMAAAMAADGVKPAEASVMLNARSLRNLAGVHEDLVRVVKRAAELSPVHFTVIEGLRTVARQRQLVASGASQTMNSRHITGNAVDLAPHDANGAIVFDWPLYHRLAPAMKQAAAEFGVSITWGGDWVSFKDGPHFELSRTAYPA